MSIHFECPAPLPKSRYGGEENSHQGRRMEKCAKDSGHYQIDDSSPARNRAARAIASRRSVLICSPRNISNQWVLAGVQLLIDEQCDQEKIERIMAGEPKSLAPRPWPDGYPCCVVDPGEKYLNGEGSCRHIPSDVEDFRHLVECCAAAITLQPFVFDFAWSDLATCDQPAARLISLPTNA